MASSGSTGHLDQYVLPQQHAPQISHGLWWQPSPDIYLALVVPWATDTDTDPSCSRTVDPDMALGGSQGQDMASSHPPVESPTFLHGVQSPWLCFCFFIPPSHIPSFLPLYHTFTRVLTPAARAWASFFQPLWLALRISFVM